MANIQSLLIFSFSLPLLTIAFATLSLIFFFVLNQRRNAQHLPLSPPALPIIGHLHYLLKSPIHHTLDRLTTNYGPLLHLRCGSSVRIIAGSADLARELLKNHDAVFTNRPLTSVSRYVSNDRGFVVAPFGPYWLFMKRLYMTELLGSTTVAKLRPVRSAELRSMLRNILDKAQANEEVNLSKEILKLMNNEVTRMAASTASGSETEEVSELVKQFTEIVSSFNLEDYIGICRGMDLQGQGKRMRDVHTRFDRLLEGIMREKEVEKEQDKQREMKDFIDILLDVAANDNAEIKLSRESIKAFIRLLPFGSGMRGCPGITLAMKAVPVAVAALVQCFDWNVNGKVDMAEGIIGIVSMRVHQLILPVVPRLQPFPDIE
ncbi:cytochrome P450 93A2-like protein [Carex littledalei]|uniref:Cytochrome P450 93A2-like protein n=1 Tax=Carex littledalei TaxID=544730 RepID=A0A833RQ90_9POAL|nr:cytochrome P450 93A2-like protein [Carex littledalei]